jgi:hypothetical protein
VDKRGYYYLFLFYVYCIFYAPPPLIPPPHLDLPNRLVDDGKMIEADIEMGEKGVETMGAGLVGWCRLPPKI